QNADKVFATTAARDKDLQQSFVALPTFEDESRRTLARLTQFAHNANPLVTQLRPAARELSPTLRDLSGLAPDLKALLPTVNPLNPENLAVYPKRIGSNRPNPYRLPGGFDELPKGLAVYEDRHCKNPVPTITNTPVPGGGGGGSPVQLPVPTPELPSPLTP